MDVIEELKFFGNSQKMGGVRGGVGTGGLGWCGGHGGCEGRIEVFVKIQKKNLFWGGAGGGGWDRG